jgi:pilus assembly protein Flp/PilA
MRLGQTCTDSRCWLFLVTSIRETKMKIGQFFKKLVRDERGVSALEYAILAGVVVVAVVTAVGYLSDGLKTGFGNLSTTIGSVTAPAAAAQ